MKSSKYSVQNPIGTNLLAVEKLLYQLRTGDSFVWAGESAELLDALEVLLDQVVNDIHELSRKERQLRAVLRTLLLSIRDRRSFNAEDPENIAEIQALIDGLMQEE